MLIVGYVLQFYFNMIEGHVLALIDVHVYNIVQLFDTTLSSIQVKMVEQQVFKFYKLLSNYQMMKINDPRWKDMWYTVSVTLFYKIV